MTMISDAAHSPERGPAVGLFVAMSELSVPEAGRLQVDAAFVHRLGAVESWAGFRGLQVWADTKDATRLMMVSWWDDRSCFDAYMQSDDHRRSHARVPSGPARPRPRSFSRFEVIAE